MGGAPDIDATTRKQLFAKNVVVMQTDETSAYDPFTAGSIHLRTEGAGQIVAYVDGKTIRGIWRKQGVASPLQWLDSNNHPISLDRGPTWVEVIPAGTIVSRSSSL